MGLTRTNTSINVARALYVLICLLSGLTVAFYAGGSDYLWVGAVCGMLLASFFILVENLMKQFTLRGFSTATFGLLVGLFCAWLVSLVNIPDLIIILFDDLIRQPEAVVLGFNVALFASLGFLGIILALRGSKDEFALIIPYVRFRQDAPAGRPVLVDVDIVVDGRLEELLATGFLEKTVVVPRFVLTEIEEMARSNSVAIRARGQRGIDCLDHLKQSSEIRLTIHDSDGLASEEERAAKLLAAATVAGAKLLTSSEAVAKLARIQGVDVLNVADLARAMKQEILIGQSMELEIVKEGKEEHQGVGYTEDGVMIVVNQGSRLIGTTQQVIVMSTIETSNGLIIFSEISQDEGV